MNTTHPSARFSAPSARRLIRWARFAFAPLVAFGAFAAAQPAQTGALAGRVLNANTGTYLDKAVVTIEGTSLRALTNDFGEYQIQNVPAGNMTVKVTYTGLPERSVPAVVRAGESTTLELRLGDTGAAQAEETITLNPFVVESGRFKNAQQIAINEERQSVNIKNVVAADAFGDIPEGNVGEFIKFLPGVEISYGGTYTSEADASGISVRGFGPEDTAIYIDGVPVSSASPASLSRAVGLDMLSINNASRVELTKVPTPDMPANSVGGTINLVSKSAFEYAKPTFSWRAYLSTNSDYPNIFKKVGGPTNKKQWSTMPGFDLTYARPVTKTFGVSLTLSTSNQFNANQRYRPEWGASSVTGIDLRPIGGAQSATLANALGAASLVNPFMTRISITDSPRYSHRHSGAIKADWRPLPGLTFAGSYQLSIYDSADAARRLQFRIQRPQTWGADSTISLPYVPAAQSQNGAVLNPGNSLDMNIDSRDKIGATHTGYLTAKYQRGPWDIFASASASSSRGSYKDLEHGHFSTVDVSATSSVGKMAFENIADGRAGKLTVFDRNGAPFDYPSLANWSVPTISVRSGKAESLNDEFTYKLDVRRDLDFIRLEKLHLAIKTGLYRQQSLAKKWGVGTGFTMNYTGPALTSTDYLDPVYTGHSPGYGFPAQQWISTYRLYDYYKANPTLFNADTDAAKVSNYNSYVNQNKRIKDTADAWYAQLEGHAFANRLSFVAGLRQQKSQRDGRGPLTDSKWNYLKVADGELYRDAAHPNGVRIDQAASDLFATNAAGTALRSALNAAKVSYPDHVVLNTTLEGRMLQLKPLQEVHARTQGKPSFSVSTSYNVTENIVAKVAWSRTFGQISLEDGTRGLLSGNNAYVINEADVAGSVPAGTISVANPNLKPWISDNWDYALYYYTAHGGKLGLSYFTKRVSNFQETLTINSSDPNFNPILDSIGLNPADYQDWYINTNVNGGGSAKNFGIEWDVSQDLRFLRFLGDWGRRFNVFATYTTKRRSESRTSLISTTRPSSDRTASAGLQFATNRFNVLLKSTWTDVKWDGSTTNVSYNGVTYGLGGYTPSTFKLDASANWQFSKKYGFFISGRDILNRGSRKERYDLTGLYPAYAQWDDLRNFGVQITFGVKGTF